MRRSLLLSMSLVLTAAVLVGCGSDGDTTSNDAASETDTDMSPGDMPPSDMDHGEASPAAPDARRIPVSASSMHFEPTEIRVAADEDIAIALTSDDTLLHDFTIDELEAHVPAAAGETAEGGIRPGEPGRYTFYCSVEGHREAGMEGTLIVE